MEFNDNVPLGIEAYAFTISDRLINFQSRLINFQSDGNKFSVVIQFFFFFFFFLYKK